MEGHPAIPPELETVPISDDGFTVIEDADGVWRMKSHPGIKRDARRLLAALGDVERDLQGTMEGQWILALRPSLSIIAQRDQRGYDAAGMIRPGIDPAHLPADALDPDQIERTLTTDALDAVAKSTHWLLYSQGIHWPVCSQHEDARVWPRKGRWVCQQDQHELAAIGQLSPPRRRRRLRPDGTAEYIDEIADQDRRNDPPV